MGGNSGTVKEKNQEVVKKALKNLQKDTMMGSSRKPLKPNPIKLKDSTVLEKKDEPSGILGSGKNKKPILKSTLDSSSFGAFRPSK